MPFDPPCFEDGTFQAKNTTLDPDGPVDRFEIHCKIHPFLPNASIQEFVKIVAMDVTKNEEEDWHLVHDTIYVVVVVEE